MSEQLSADIARILQEHAGHLGSGGNLWNADCLSVDCSWVDHGRGTMLHAANAHRMHVADAVTSIVSAHVAAKLAAVRALADRHEQRAAKWRKTARDAANTKLSRDLATTKALYDAEIARELRAALDAPEGAGHEEGRT